MNIDFPKLETILKKYNQDLDDRYLSERRKYFSRVYKETFLELIDLRKKVSDLENQLENLSIYINPESIFPVEGEK